jgi:hypothetical protein
MEFRLFLIIVGFAISLSACVSNTYPDLRSKHNTLVAEGHTKEYVNCYMDGCAAGYSDADLSDDLEYEETWQLGYDTCREEFLEGLQKKNYMSRNKTKHKISRDYDFDERQQLIWDELSK